MAKKIPTLSPDIISNTCSDISRIVEAKHLGQKDINHETSSEGALLIGRLFSKRLPDTPSPISMAYSRPSLATSSSTLAQAWADLSQALHNARTNCSGRHGFSTGA